MVAIKIDNYIFLYSERSDEWMNVLILQRGGGGFRWKSEYSWCIIEFKIKHFPILNEVMNVMILQCRSKVNIFQQFSKKLRKRKKKEKENREFLRKNSFDQIVFYMVVTCNSKNNHCKYLKFSSHCDD
ncbi:Uncharacterized protein FWK35_00023403 [Aphis craccivora]|uniref:Uncharacterized protein n=1 Tax=Aphis craccivora TaxID=307492 RepID=A0A6G0YYR3_APHCR|nr:Uncharacterized protein FWK35_00023403 [Aphis craccivora]